MKKVGDMMKELGFKEGASDEVAKAFIKNLIRQAYGAEVKEAFAEANPPKKLSSINGPAKPEQLAFKLDLELSPSLPRPKKRA